MDLEKLSEDEDNDHIKNSENEVDDNLISRYSKYPLIVVGVYYTSLSLYELVYNFAGIYK